MSTGKPNAPCKTCEYRRLHCHSECKAYSEYMENNKSYKVKERAYNDFLSFVYDCKRNVPKTEYIRY